MTIGNVPSILGFEVQTTDFVNVEPGPDGLSRGQNWMMKERENQPKNYLPDDRTDSRLYTYEELFLNWQKLLPFPDWRQRL